MATWATVRRLCKKFPEVEESTWYRSPSFKVRGKGFVRLKDPGVIVVFVSLEEKEILLRAEPDVFFTTPHYDGYAAFLIRLSAINTDELWEMLVESWRRAAPKRLIKEFENETS